MRGPASVQAGSDHRQQVCLSCSHEAVSCDTLVDMLFFQLPLSARNNLGCAAESGTEHIGRRVAWMTLALTPETSSLGHFQSRGDFHTLSGPFAPMHKLDLVSTCLGFTTSQLSKAAGAIPKAAVSEPKAPSPQQAIPTSNTPLCPAKT